MRVLAIDQGTSATKAVVDDDGVVLAEAEAEAACGPTATIDGGVEVDPDRLWNSVLAAARQAIAISGGDASDAVGLATRARRSSPGRRRRARRQRHRVAGPAKRVVVRPVAGRRLGRATDPDHRAAT